MFIVIPALHKKENAIMRSNNEYLSAYDMYRKIANGEIEDVSNPRVESWLDSDHESCIICTADLVVKSYPYEGAIRRVKYFDWLGMFDIDLEKYADDDIIPDSRKHRKEAA
jgi:hypothetical protein